MQDLLNSESNDEIDLRELFIILWAINYSLLAPVLGHLFGGYYALECG